MKRFISCMIAVVMLLSLAVGTSASELEVISFDQITGTLTVADDNVAGAEAGDVVTMIILNPGFSFQDIENGTKTLGEAAYAIKYTQIKKSSNGYGYTFGAWTLPASTKIGNYELRIGMGGGYVIDGSFYFITLDLLRAAVNEIDNATASEMSAKLNEKEELFGLDLTNYNALSSKSSVNAKMSAEDFSVADDATSEEINTQIENIKTKLYEFVSVAALDEAESGSTVEEFLTENGDLFGIDMSEESAYGKLSNSSKEKVLDRMAEDSFDELSDVKEKFDEHCVLVRFENGSYGDAAKLIAENNDILGFDLTDYNKLSSENKTFVHKKMVENSPVYKTTLEAKKVFDDAVWKATESNKSAGNGTSSGSSSGRGSSSKGSSGVSKVVGLPPATAVPTEKPTEMPTEEPKAETSEDKYFNDLSNVSWAEESINALYKEGIISGRETGIFAPNDSVTRAELIKMLTEAIITVDENAVSTFTDVKESAWYYKYAATCQSAGLVLGYEDGSFNPDAFILRQEMAVMVKRFLNHKGVNLTKGTADEFADSNKIAEYAKDAAGELFASGIMSGDENKNFMPNDNVTRAQAAKVIYAALQLCR